jgi:hypothetical protein
MAIALTNIEAQETPVRKWRRKSRAGAAVCKAWMSRIEAEAATAARRTVRWGPRRWERGDERIGSCMPMTAQDWNISIDGCGRMSLRESE